MKIFRGILCALLVSCVAFTFIFGYKKISEQKLKNPIVNKSVLTLWQIDSFEGGTGSRKQFLLKASREFERVNKDYLIMVVEHTVSSAETAFKEGNKPDMISYGAGLNISNPTQIKVNTNSELGLIGKKHYAVCWARGGYVMIRNVNMQSSKDCVVVSVGANNLSKTAYLLSGIKSDEVEFLQANEAFQLFANGKAKYLFGTQRDLFRLKNRNMQIEVEGIEQFNDLMQYLSILTLDTSKHSVCESFANFLLSEKVQKSLSSLGLFSVEYQVEYSDDNLAKIQNTSFLHTVSPLIGKKNLESISHFANMAINGDANSLNKIKNMII